MSIDWLYPKEVSPEDYKANDGTKVVIVYPGIGGHSYKAYVKYLSRFLCYQGQDYVIGVIHGRGCGFTELLTPKFMDFTRVSDY